MCRQRVQQPRRRAVWYSLPSVTHLGRHEDRRPERDQAHADGACRWTAGHRALVTGVWPGCAYGRLVPGHQRHETACAGGKAH